MAEEKALKDEQPSKKIRKGEKLSDEQLDKVAGGFAYSMENDIPNLENLGGFGDASTFKNIKQSIKRKFMALFAPLSPEVKAAVEDPLKVTRGTFNGF